LRPQERADIEELSQWVTVPGKWEKQFIATLAARPPEYALSAEQRRHLYRLLARWRRVRVRDRKDEGVKPSTGWPDPEGETPKPTSGDQARGESR
jgi:hypothetical protein